MFRCAHIADIHIRSLTRHEEIRSVVEAFVCDIKKLNVDAIIIVGDVFHNKTNIVPEAIKEISSFFKSLTDVADVYVTLGNHDFNISNLDRLDVISPIVDLLKKQQLNHKLELFKYSGVYALNDKINFCVYSIIDRHNWKVVAPQQNKINIATFHGPLNGAKTEVNYKIVDEMTVDFFSNYDIVMLGDIHKTQFLDSKPTKCGQMPWIGYPGSFLQNTYAEELVHGYFLWDIESSDDFAVEFRKLPNIHPFVTLDWKGSIEDSIKNIPNAARCRIRTTMQLDQATISELSNVLYHECNAIEVIVKDESIVSDNLLSGKNNQSVLENLRDPQTLLKFVKKINSDVVFDQDDDKRFEDLIRKYLIASVDVSDTSRHSRWSLKSLSFDNVFGYGQDNVIDFTKFDGLTGIFGPNKIGKSSIPGVLMYAIFNASDRGSIKNIDICNDLYDHCKATAEVVLNDKSYVIERTTTKRETKKGIVNANTSLEITELTSDGVRKSLNDDGRIETDKFIRRLFGTSEDFEVTHLSSQGNGDVLLKKKSTERWNYLAKFLDIDIFSRMCKVVGDDVKVLKAKLKDYPNKDWKSLAEHLIEESKICEDKLNQCSIQLEQSRDELSILEQQLSKERLVVLSTPEQIERLKNRVLEITHKKSTLDEKISQLKLQQESDIEQLTFYKTKLNSFDQNALQIAIDTITATKTSLLCLKHDYEKQLTVSETIKKSLTLLQQVPCGDKFSHCKFIKNAHDHKEQHAEQQLVLQRSLEALTLEESKLKKLLDSNPEKLFAECQQITTKINTLKVSIAERSTKIETLSVKTNEAVNTLILENSKLQEAEATLDLNLVKRIEVLTEQITSLKNNIKKFDLEKTALATQKGKIQAETKILLDEKKKRKALLDEITTLDVLAKSFSRKGIPRAIISTQLPIINVELAKILSNVVDFTIEFCEDEDTDRLDIFINYGDRKRILELGSGMEKTIGCIAMRLALINISSLPKADIFIVDEGFGTLDSENIDACIRLLRTLTQYFKHVIVISHIDAIKEVVDNIIEVTKVNNDSKIIFA